MALAAVPSKFRYGLSFLIDMAFPPIRKVSGGLTALPLAYMGCKLDGGEDGCWGGAVMGALVGYLVGTAVGATIGWHVTKERRVSNGRFTLGRPPATAQPGEIRVTVPVLAFSF